MMTKSIRVAFKTFAAFSLMAAALCEAGGPISTNKFRAAANNQAGQAEDKAHRALRCAQNTGQIVAAPLHHPLAHEFPVSADWNTAGPTVFCSNWKGELDPQGETEVRVLWSRQFLYFRFLAHYRELSYSPGTTGRHERLWQRDVVEVFLQADTKLPDHYKEVEVSPKGQWLDLDIFPGGSSNLMCNLRTNTSINEKQHVWIAELALPIKCITQTFDPGAEWKLNLFRIEGSEPDRRYFAWQPTNTQRPDFHVPEVFGTLKFSHD